MPNSKSDIPVELRSAIFGSSITKLKMIKRQRYGPANLELLRARLCQWAFLASCIKNSQEPKSDPHVNRGHSPDKVPIFALWVGFS
jgi:hypothetical protein